MLTADPQKETAAKSPEDRYQFKHLPRYASFLLEHHLDEFAATLLQISRRLDVPLLRYFAAWPEEQLVALGREGNGKLLRAIVDDAVPEFIEENLQAWKNNQLPLVQSDDIVIEDISKVNFTRRQAFRQFLPRYSTDPAEFIAIMEEVDYFTLIQEEIYFKTLFEMKEQKIREHHHFIDKIANTSPGILYVFDLLHKKQIYANHKQQEGPGYTTKELNEMDSDSKFSTVIHPDDLPKIEQHYQEFESAGDAEIRTLEYRVRHKDGRYSWQRGYETVFKRTETGQPSEIIGVALDVSAEKEAYSQLEQRESQLREAQELAGMGSFDWDLSGNGESRFSPQLFKIFGMDGVGKLEDFLEFVHPSDRPSLREAMARSMAGAGPYECEYRYRKDGVEKVIWSRGLVSFDDGKPVRMKGTVMDVTLRHDMIKRLERSEQLHKQAQALTQLGNWSWSLVDDKVEWSDELYRIFGLRPQSESMRLSRILSLIHPDDRAGRYEALHRAIETRKAEDYTIRVITEDGTLKFVEGKTEVLTDEQGRPYKLLGTVQDITRQHMLNEQLRENEEASSQLINNAPDAIIVFDEESNILLWNPKAESIFGWRFDEVSGKNLTDTIIPADFRNQHTEGIRRLQASSPTGSLNRTIEVTAVKKNGESFYISLTVSGSVRSGKPVFIAFIRDISNEKATEQKLIEQRSQLSKKNLELERNNQELTAFNYIASHDLQEPVRKIQVFSNMILEQEAASLPGTVKDSAERIAAAAQHMHRLIEALIAFSRSTTGEKAFELTDLNAILLEVKTQLKDQIEEHGARIVADTLPVLRAIPFQMQQLLENIIGNAIKYRKPGLDPLIRIEAELLRGSEVEQPGIDPAHAYWQLSVSDNGIGFDQQYAEKAFELFQRLHDRHAYAGTGIGLAICKKIVQNHDGFIDASSCVGEGTCFRILLPADPLPGLP